MGFYKELEKTPSAAEALRKTKIHSITHAPASELAAPYYWAGHQLMGDCAFSEYESTNRKSLKLFGAVITIILALTIPVLYVFKRRRQ
jgi:hypothetical protein